jgi:YHS domain-containing protein
MKKLTVILMVVLLSVGITVLLAGCKEKSGSPTEPSSSEHDATSMAEEGDMAEEAIENTEMAVDQAKETATEQTICPVMGGPIDKNIFVEYKGKKVYFCCPSCKGQFEKDPEKYLSKLPQFQK